jgi:hypothetical protein
VLEEYCYLPRNLPAPSSWLKTETAGSSRIFMNCC